VADPESARVLIASLRRTIPRGVARAGFGALREHRGCPREDSFGYYTRSVAITSDGSHSLTDSFSNIVGLAGSNRQCVNELEI
jgi:hypothetical protein